MADVNATPKRWWASKTIWGGIIGAASLAAGYFGHSVDPATQAVVIDKITAVAATIGDLVGLGLTLWGRASATRPIG